MTTRDESAARPAAEDDAAWVAYVEGRNGDVFYNREYRAFRAGHEAARRAAQPASAVAVVEGLKAKAHTKALRTMAELFDNRFIRGRSDKRHDEAVIRLTAFREVLDAIRAAGPSEPAPAPSITEAEIDAALDAWFEGEDWRVVLEDHPKERAEMRKALEAAWRARHAR